MKLWLSRRTNGLYLLTAIRPVFTEVRGTGIFDYYLQPGDPIGINHLCEAGVQSLFGRTLEVGDQVRVTIAGDILGHARSNHPEMAVERDLVGAD